tara:strand:+ start:838 stop:1146 length:309 start_codon:yes stop_codon:yes gene_type:complete
MIIYVDIDETICYRENKDKLEYKKAKPYKDRIEKINKLYKEGNTVVYWTARGTGSGKYLLPLCYKQLTDWGCLFHGVKINKPIYDLFIDDKNINSDDYFKNN